VISVRLSSGTTVNATMINLSPGGAGFLYEVPAEIGATLGFSFTLNTTGQQRVLELRGVVRHCHLTPEGFYTGVEWRDVTDELCCMMQAFLSDRVRIKQAFSG
jgi:hypothetical protein